MLGQMPRRSPVPWDAEGVGGSRSNAWTVPQKISRSETARHSNRSQTWFERDVTARGANTIYAMEQEPPLAMD